MSNWQGVAVGEKLGNAVGKLLGLLDGMLEGEKLGSAVGDAVGTCVGSKAHTASWHIPSRQSLSMLQVCPMPQPLHGPPQSIPVSLLFKKPSTHEMAVGARVGF